MPRRGTTATLGGECPGTGLVAGGAGRVRPVCSLQVGLQAAEQPVDVAGHAQFRADCEGLAAALPDEFDGFPSGLLVACEAHGDQGSLPDQAEGRARPMPRLEPVTRAVLPLSLHHPRPRTSRSAVVNGAEPFSPIAPRPGTPRRDRGSAKGEGRRAKGEGESRSGVRDRRRVRPGRAWWCAAPSRRGRSARARLSGIRGRPTYRSTRRCRRGRPGCRCRPVPCAG